MYDGVNISPFEVMFVKVCWLRRATASLVHVAHAPAGRRRAQASQLPGRFLRRGVPALLATPAAASLPSCLPPLPLPTARLCGASSQVKEFLLEANWTTATSAKKYTTWNRKQVGWWAGRGRACVTWAATRHRLAVAVWEAPALPREWCNQHPLCAAPTPPI